MDGSAASVVFSSFFHFCVPCFVTPIDGRQTHAPLPLFVLLVPMLIRMDADADADAPPCVSSSLTVVRFRFPHGA